MSGPIRLSGSLGRGVGAGQPAELRVGEAAWGLFPARAGVPAAGVSCLYSVRTSLQANFRSHKCAFKTRDACEHTHPRTPQKGAAHHSVSWGFVSSFCFRKLICMNQVTKPTSRRAGERKQMLFLPGRIELSSLSLWLNSASLKAQTLVKKKKKKKRKKKHDCSLSGFGSCSGLSAQSCSSQEKCKLSVADGDENRARGRGNAASGSLKALASFSQEGN